MDRMENRLQTQADQILRILKEKGKYQVCFPCRRIPLKRDQESINDWLVAQGGVTIVSMGSIGTFYYTYKQP